MLPSALLGCSALRRAAPHLLALAALATCCCLLGADAGASRIVLITLDTLRYDQLPAQEKSDAPVMPALRRRADRGRRFAHFYAPMGVTQPSHASMFTGLQPWEHGVARNGLPLSAAIPTVAELLGAAGFENRAVIASFPLTRRFGFARGFDSFVQEFDHSGSHDRWEQDWRVPDRRFYSLADDVTNRALTELAAATGDKQFFWFHYFDPHAPYGVTSGEAIRMRETRKAALAHPERVPGLIAEVRAAYRRDVEFLDRELERLFEQIERDAESTPTHVLVVADHGESLGEGALVGHGTRLVEEQLRVPAFILSPKVAPGTAEQVAGSVDVFRTLLALAGIPAPAAAGGRNLLREAPGQARAFAMRKTFRGDSFTEKRLNGSRETLTGVRFCEIDAGGAMVCGNAEGLHSAADALPADRRRALVARFRRFEARLRGAPASAPLDAKTREALEALGYVEE